ncbi:hypothetical protein LTR53_003796 [Teratosphaeriaceae sp. CCFEE 6253]|nr:hypothetical protein LTR53_003796 [Teratosphaeriaceae sp. CCFEE 6253]
MLTPLENQKQLVDKIRKAEESWDLDAIVSLRTPDATQELLPKTLGWPVLDNVGFKERMGGLAPIFQGCYKIKDLSTVHDADAHKATAHWMQTASTNTPGGGFALESVWMWTFTGDGTQVVSAKEFVDSAYLSQWLEKLQGDVGKEEKS